MDENGADVLDASATPASRWRSTISVQATPSLGYLKRFQVSSLKIDQQFVPATPDDVEDAAIVTAVIQMSKALGITVVAEGVETGAGGVSRRARLRHPAGLSDQPPDRAAAADRVHSQVGCSYARGLRSATASPIGRPAPGIRRRCRPTTWSRSSAAPRRPSRGRASGCRGSPSLRGFRRERPRQTRRPHRLAPTMASDGTSR